MTTTLHLESAPLGEFLELHEHDTRLRVRLGTIGQPCLVLHATYATAPGKAQQQCQRVLAQWQAQGFAQCAPTAPVTEGSVADELFCDGRIAHPLLEPFLKINGASGLRGKPRRLAWFRDGLRWHSHFDLERIAALGLHGGIVVEGDVQVKGVFSQLTYTYPAFTLVSGDIRAHSFGHGDSHMRVMGDVRVDNIIYGEYNDGSLRIDGSAHGRAFITSGHDMGAEGGYHLPVCDWDTDENWSDCLHPDLLEWDGDDDEPGRSLSNTAIRAFMREGRDPFRPGAQPTLRKPAEPAMEPPPPSEFAQALHNCVLAEDVEAITRLLETWPVRDAEWHAALAGRLCAPSTTQAQRARLLALKQRG